MVIAASSVAVVFVQNAYQLNYAQSIYLQNTKDISITSIKIVFAINSSDNEVKVWIKNTGRYVFEQGQIKQFNIFFGPVTAPVPMFYNGSFDSWVFEIVNDYDEDGRLDPGETLEITITLNYTVLEGDYLVMANTHNGVDDKFFFSV